MAGDVPSRRDLTRKTFRIGITAFLALSAMFFIPAGTLAYWQAGLYLGTLLIPMVFVVGKDSKVLWFGHPTEELAPLMDRILAGKYDVQAEVRRRDGENLIRDYLVAAHQGNP